MKLLGYSFPELFLSRKEKLGLQICSKKSPCTVVLPGRALREEDFSVKISASQPGQFFVCGTFSYHDTEHLKLGRYQNAIMCVA